MNTIKVRLYATLRKYHPGPSIGEPLVIRLDDGTKLDNLFDKLKIPKEEVKVILVNGRREEGSYSFQDGDRVGIFSPIGGG
jgi:molybdopterin converting factor small subunit